MTVRVDISIPANEKKSILVIQNAHTLSFPPIIVNPGSSASIYVHNMNEFIIKEENTTELLTE